MTRFVILAAPRTGSNLLCTLLNSHPDLLCHHEVFNPQGVFTALDYPDPALQSTPLERRDGDPLGFLERVWASGNHSRGVGFKWTRGQNQTVLQHVVGEAEVKKIVLRRKNRVKTFVSERIAQQTQQWEVYRQDELVLPRPQIVIDPEDLLHHVDLNQRFYSELMVQLQAGQPYLAIDYEDLFDHQVQQNLLNFLDVSALHCSEAQSVKQNPRDLREIVANFDQLLRELVDVELKAELTDLGL